MIATVAGLTLLAATVAPAAFLLARRSFVANVFGLGLALEAAGQLVSLMAAGLDALLDSL